MKTSDFDYDLPIEYIAQNPVEPRDSSRLMALDKKTGDIRHLVFKDIVTLLNPNDLLILNQTRVIPARLSAQKKPGGGQVEILLLKREDDKIWEVMVGGKGLNLGRQIEIENGPLGEIVEVLDGPRRKIGFSNSIDKILDDIGKMPLPPYIHGFKGSPDRYQTIFAKISGSAAAPTAGLHFTNELLDTIKKGGVNLAYVVLHIGLDTFAPVKVERPVEHKIHSEWCQVPEETATLVTETKKNGGKVICVGTTSVRSIETAGRAATSENLIGRYMGQTDLFILPGYHFKVVDAIITNFHLPKSTLLMMISAFAGREKVLEAYEVAKKEKYRFYSFGDAMFIF